MALVTDIDAERFELIDECLDLQFMVYRSTVTDFLVTIPGQHFIYSSGYAICYGHFRLIRRAKLHFESVILVAIEGAPLLLGSMSCLDEQASQVRVAFATFRLFFYQPIRCYLRPHPPMQQSCVHL